MTLSLRQQSLSNDRKHRLPLYRLAGLLVALILSACSGTYIAKEQQLDENARDAAIAATDTPEAIYEQAVQKYLQAEKDQLDFYSPLHFARAARELERGTLSLNDGTPYGEVVEAFFSAMRLLQEGYVVKEQVLEHLAVVLAKQKDLARLNVKERWPKDQAEIDRRVRKLIEFIESDLIDEAIVERQFLMEYLEGLEVRFVKITYFVEVQNLLEKARLAGAEIHAPQTFAKALQVHNSTERYIEQHARELETIAELCHEAATTARHAFSVAVESAALTNMDPVAAEQHILYLEGLFARINQHFPDNDLRGLSLSLQADRLAELVGQLMKGVKPEDLQTRFPVREESAIQQADTQPEEDTAE